MEWWEIVELVRKLILTGVLIYFPTTSRAAAAVIVCVVCVAMLNLYERTNTRIFWVCQGSYLIRRQILGHDVRSVKCCAERDVGRDFNLHRCGHVRCRRVLHLASVSHASHQEAGREIGRCSQDWQQGASDARKKQHFSEREGQLSGQNPVSISRSKINFESKSIFSGTLWRYPKWRRHRKRR